MSTIQAVYELTDSATPFSSQLVSLTLKAQRTIGPWLIQLPLTIAAGRATKMIEDYFELT